MKRLLLILIVCCLLLVAPSTRAYQQQTPPQPVAAVASGTATLRQETFDIVWRTVKEKHWDPTLGGVDWDNVRRQYEPKANAAKTDREFYIVLQEMLGELHQSHFAIIPPEAIVTEDTHEPQGGGIGVDVRFIDGQAVISKVEPGSRAAAAGIRTGFVVLQVNETPVQRVIDRFKNSQESAAIQKLRLARVVLALIDGKPDTTVKLTVLDGEDKQREFAVQRERLKGEMSARLGNFPPQYTEFEAKRLDGGIGYIRFNIFVMLVLDRIKDAIRNFHGAPGIIIDIRGNPGGFGGMAPGIAGVLQKTQTSLGVMTMRAGYQNFVAFPQPNPYTGPVVILTDGCSGSTSEIFAAGMQDIGRAVVVGERTMGAALPSVFFKLPTGAIFQYAFADFKTPKGALVEGNGVKPDVEVKLTRKVLLEGRDPQLESAVEQIKKRAGSGTGSSPSTNGSNKEFDTRKE